MEERKKHIIWSQGKEKLWRSIQSTCRLANYCEIDRFHGKLYLQTTSPSQPFTLLNTGLVRLYDTHDESMDPLSISLVVSNVVSSMQCNAIHLEWHDLTNLLFNLQNPKRESTYIGWIKFQEEEQKD